MARQLEIDVMRILAAVDVTALDVKAAKLVAEIKQQVVDARLDIRDWEMSETRQEQLQNERIASKRLEDLRRDILAASEYNIFSAVDVAQLTARIDSIAEQLE